MGQRPGGAERRAAEAEADRALGELVDAAIALRKRAIATRGLRDDPDKIEQIVAEIGRAARAARAGDGDRRDVEVALAKLIAPAR